MNNGPVPALSVVVPVYNEEQSLPDLLEMLTGVLRTLPNAFEIILVNDGSGDNSWSTIEHIMPLNSAVRGIDLLRNYGQHNAVLCGIREAIYDVTVTIDEEKIFPDFPFTGT